MPKMEIIGPTFDGRKANTAWGTRVLMDGVEVPEVREITVRACCDELLTAKMEVNVTESLHFEGDAALHVSIVTHPGFRIVETVRPDGAKVYDAVAIVAAEAWRP